MILDVLMAFVMALFLEVCSLLDKRIKQLTVFACCLTGIVIYFVNGYQIDFIGEIDLAIWTMFVIVFNMLLNFVLKKYKGRV